MGEIKDDEELEILGVIKKNVEPQTAYPSLLPKIPRYVIKCIVFSQLISSFLFPK